LRGCFLTSAFDGLFEVIRIDFLAECREGSVNIAIGLETLLSLCQELFGPQRSNRRVVIELAEMSAARFLDELALVGVDPRFIEEPLDLSVKLDRELDADTRVFYSSTIVLQRYK